MKTWLRLLPVLEYLKFREAETKKKYSYKCVKSESNQITHKQ